MNVTLSKRDPTTLLQHQATQTYLTRTETAIIPKCTRPHFKITSNLTPMEQHAIQSLKMKKDTVIIKQADNGSTLTIVSREKYINDGNL